MNQEKIGKFICECRNEKKMTQSELAEKLGVSDKSVGNWENGRNMPDLSLFKPLCDELGITVNEFLSGERLDKKVYQEKFEENIINTIDYSTKRIHISDSMLWSAVFIFGIVITLVVLTTLPSDSSWGSIYSIIGTIISSVGLFKLLNKFSTVKKYLFSIIYFIVALSFIFIIDYVSVVKLNQIPRFCYVKSYGEKVMTCKNLFYTVYKVNRDTKNEYIIVDTKKKYTEDTLPVVPFNLNKSSIENISRYKNKYVGNNSNDVNLINSLPLSEYGFVINIDSTDLGIKINYHITDWYINENLYVEKSLLYNSVSMFSLIDNLKYIDFDFSGKEYHVEKTDVISNYPGYFEFAGSSINIESFNKNVTYKMNDDEFIKDMFNKLFNK